MAAWTAAVVAPGVEFLVVIVRAVEVGLVARELNCEPDDAATAVEVDTEVVVDALAMAEWARKAARKLEKKDRLVGMLGELEESGIEGWWRRLFLCLYI